MPVWIGTAGWSIPRAHAAAFPPEGSHLARYATRFTAAEIDTSFYRPHRPATYARWAETVPPGFRFAVKLPRTITHDARLIDTEGLLRPFLEAVRCLGDCLGPLLVQLPPSLAFDPATAHAFMASLRRNFEGEVVCEPRHPTWFTGEADTLLADAEIARVAADPAIVSAAARPGGWPGLHYHRLHGSPQLYASRYGPDAIQTLAADLRQAANSWCIFDNTARGEAAGNALQLLQAVGG